MALNERFTVPVGSCGNTTLRVSHLLPRKDCAA